MTKSELDLPIDEWFLLGSTDGAKARELYIKDNADYYNVVWRKDLEYKKVRFPKKNAKDAAERQYAYENAWDQAQFAANYLQHPVMIYAVIEIPDTTNGYDTLAAVVHPTWSATSETSPPRQDS